MPKICYTPKNFTSAHCEVILQANMIIGEYQRLGLSLTLRQLYYQFVSRDLIANNMREYKRLGDIINQAREAGQIDWNAIEDRTRSLRGRSHWNSPRQIVESCAGSYHIDLWQGQKRRVEVWIEKDALVGVIENVCWRYDVSYFSCRGYTSASEMWSAAQRVIRTHKNNPGLDRVLILHLGDHDPSGIDMTRDIQDRLDLFCSKDDCPSPFVKRIALNRDQIDEYAPPPNPAKLTDSRSDKYVAEHGTESWELDALRPELIEQLISSQIEPLIERRKWRAREKEIEEARAVIKKAAESIGA